MESHRYSRRQLSHNKLDSYNALLVDHLHHDLEYWTNGRTTYVNNKVTLSKTVADKVASHVSTSVTPLWKATLSPVSAHRRTMVSSKRPRSTVSSSTQPSDPHVVRNSLLAGSISGMTSTFAMYPLEVIRTKMQSSSLHSNTHHGPLQTFRHTLQNGGVRALYTGLTMPLAAQAVYKGTVFAVNNVTQRAILEWKTLENHKQGVSQNATLTMTDRFVAGSVGGAVNAFLFVTPVEFVRNQLIAQHSKLAAGRTVARLASGSWDVVRHAVQTHGATSLWRGAGMAVTRDAVGCGCFFYTMAWTQKQLTPRNEVPSFPVTVLSGGMAGLAFWVSILPLDTLKTWIQSSDLTESVSASESLQRVYRQSGYQGLVQQLFRGWQVAYGRGIPSAAITISVYSMAYGMLQEGSNGL
jgi:solute carrier family 25 carnitine/acylcarnitine transporter 20/29